MIFKHILDLFLCFQGGKKAEGASSTTPAGVETRLDKEEAERRRVAAKIAVHKHRASQHPNNKRAVLDKRTSYYYRKKAERDSLLQTRRDKAVQAEMLFQSSDCPYPTQGAFQWVVRWVRGRIHATGKRFAFLFKGLLKSSDQKTKQEFNQLHVKCATPTKNIPIEALRKHISSIKQKRDHKNP